MEKSISRVTFTLGGTEFDLEVVAGSGQERYLKVNGIWERHISLFLGQLFESFKTPVLFDVGANIGYYTVFAAKFGAKVVAFEPNPAIRAILQRNLATNACADVVVDDRIVCREGATLKLVEPDQFEEGSNAISVAPEDSDPSISIDGYVAAGGSAPDIIKIDAEGRDLDVVHGALSTMARAQPIVIFEFQPCAIATLDATNPAEIFPAVRQLGYTPYLFKGHTGVACSMVDYEILSRIYDLAVANRDANHWDVLLWPPRLRPLIKPYEAPN